ncbi:MAG TPA: YtxH domain-containing protein [Ferruginibacter sp.]|jgi:gas vesicle protein|nr:YtxH domain-containing protein [Ferruginibacter sp.]
MKSKKIIAAVLLGAAAGAIAGVLFAPDKGAATREKIKEAGEDLKNTFKDKFNEFVDDIKEKYENAKQENTNTI